MGGQARADAERDGHDPAGGDARHVDDVGEVQRGRGARLAGLLDEVLHKRLRDLPEVQRGQVRPPEREHARGQREPPAVGPDVAEALEREQDAARRRAGRSGEARDLAQRGRGVLPGEHLQHRQTPLE
jgi:hypothetical protein